MKKWFSLGLIMVFVVTLFYNPPKVAAADDEYVTIDLVEDVTYTDTQAILDRINEIRLEACKEGIVLNGKALTMADYAPMQWSSDMEEIAIQRAAEASYSLSHTRPDGSQWYTVQSSGGQNPESGGIASTSEAITSINLFYTEKENLVSQNGGVTGHYTALIDPRHKYVGIASFQATAAEYSSTPGTSTKRIAYKGERRTTSIRVKKSAFTGTIYGPKHNDAGKKITDFHCLSRATICQNEALN